MAKWLIYLGGRRFFLSQQVFFSCCFLVYVKAIDGNIFRDIIMATVAVYIAGNVYQKVKEKAIDANQDN